MGIELNEYERHRALESIFPELIGLENNHRSNGLSELVEFSGSDLGRGMLNHDRFALIENLPDFNFEQDTIDIHEAKVRPSSIDNLILTYSLKAFLSSLHEKNTGDLSILIPPFSYGYSLFLSFHLILQHMGEKLSQILGARFEDKTGIMIISDNVEIFSRISRTTINKVYLKDYMNIFSLQAGEFKEFKFSKEDKKASKVNKYITKDDSIPWLTLYRAIRHQLPEVLEKKPKVIIIDLLPLRHRGRAESLIKWAKQMADHVIVIAPLHEDEIFKILFQNNIHVLPIDKYLFDSLKDVFLLERQEHNNPITSSWNLSSSLNYFNPSNKATTIQQINNINSLDSLIREAFEVLQHGHLKDGTLSTAFGRLKNMLLKIVSLSVSLEWFERSRIALGKPTLLELIDIAQKIPPNNYEEKVIYENLLHQAHSVVLQVYNLMKNYEGSLRSDVISKLLTTDSDINTLIIVDDLIIKDEIKIWLRSHYGFKSDTLANLNIMTQEEWASNQIKELSTTEMQFPKRLIITNPWKKKYLSSFYSIPETDVHYIGYIHEIQLIKYQISKMGDKNITYLKSFEYATQSLFNIAPFLSKPVDEIKKAIEIVELKANAHFNKTHIEENQNKRSNGLDDLFNNEVILRILSEDDEGSADDDISTINYMDKLHVTEDQFIDAIKCTVLGFGSSEAKTYFVSSEQNIKVKKLNIEELTDSGPLELIKGDIVIKLKMDLRKELFENVLKLASNTMAMKWIQINVNEWKEMTNLLWHKFHLKGQFNIRTQEKIITAVNKNGGSVESNLTILNWMKGGLVKEEKNVKAVAKILGDERYLNRWKTIYRAMRELWNIHSKLGRAIGRIVLQQAQTAILSSTHDDKEEWVDLGSEIRISTTDILEVLDLFEVIEVDKQRVYKIHNILIERSISISEEELVKKGLLIDGK